MRELVRVSGLRELEKNLAQLEKRTTRRSVGRRVLRKGSEPMLEAAIQNAPDDPATTGNDLNASIVESGSLSKSQRGARNRDKAVIERYIGTNDPAGMQQEFGNINHPPQSWLRPAFESTKSAVLSLIAKLLGGEITKSVKRQARVRR